MIQIEPLYEPIAEKDIAAVERRLGVKLPAEYRAFLKQYNGGEPEPDSFDVPRWGRTNVNRLFGIQDGKTYDLERNQALLAGRLPSDCLAIADDPAGNRILLGISGQSKGKIYLWDHEKEPPEESIARRASDFPNVHKVADGLDDFLKKLRD